MLIKGLLDLIYNILDLILFVELPEMPDDILYLAGEATNYVLMGIGVLRVFLGQQALGVLSVVFLIAGSTFAFYFSWSLVFWILRKIPMLNIKE